MNFSCLIRNSVFLAVALGSNALGQTSLPTFTVGERNVIIIGGKDTYWINDSAFPFLPDKAGTGKIAFLGDGEVRRYAGPDIDHLMSSPEGKVPVTDAPGQNGSWHANGSWMLTATRVSDGTLVGFVHGEDHTFADKKYGEWNSTGVWTSTDDGLNWVNQGEVIGSKKPDVHTIAGTAMNECVWDTVNKRWLGYYGPYAFTSSDPHGLPGTWFGYHNGTFSQPIDVNAPMPQLTPVPGLAHANVSWGGLTYNSYLKQYVMSWCHGQTILAAFSPDGINWGQVVTLYHDTTTPGATGDDITYAFIVGDTDTTSGQDCNLVYMYHPPGKTVSKNRKDMVRQSLHFQL